MPARRAQDVVHVVMTDHRIQRRPPPGDPIAPLAEHESHIDDVRFLDRAEVPEGPLGEVYRAVTILRAMPRNDAATSFLSRHLRSEEHTSELQSLTNLVCRLLLEKKKQHAALHRPDAQRN